MSPLSRAVRGGMFAFLLAAAVSIPISIAAASPSMPAGAPTSTDRIGPASGTSTVRTLAPTGARYVDPATGNDHWAGTRLRPWRTLGRASRADLRPGTRLRLSRRTQVGELILAESGTAAEPIIVQPYGPGDRRPVVTDGNCVSLKGSHLTITGLLVRNCGTGQDFRYGIGVWGAHDRVTHTVVTGNVIGIMLDRASSYAVVSGNHIYGNRGMVIGPGCDDDYGAQGVSVGGDHARIVHNRIDGQVATSPDYGKDGSAVEVVGARETVIADNTAAGNIGFVELGRDPVTHEITQETTLAYNQVTGAMPAATMQTCVHGSFTVRQNFLIARGSTGDSTSQWGPTLATSVVHNSVRFTGAGSIGIVCDTNCTPSVLQVHANILIAGDPGWVDTGIEGFGHSANVLSDPGYYDVWGSDTVSWAPARMHPGDSYAQPRFADPARSLRLAAGSPALDRVAPIPGWRFDLAGTPVPQSGRADIGAYERPAARAQ